MKLSLWHCQVLYVVSNLSINDVIRVSGLESKVLTHAAKSGNWHYKKTKFASLAESHQTDLDYIELLIGDFKHNQNHLDFVNLVLAKIQERKNRETPTKEQIKEQYIAQLGEFGMDRDNASDFINRVQHELIGSTGEADLMVDAIDRNGQSTITVQDKIDTVNIGYRYLVEGHNANAAQIHDDLRRRIDFYGGMIDKLEKMMPSTISFEELASLQRTISYAAASYGKLVQIQSDISGLKGYVNKQTSIAKLCGEGYIVVDRDDMGRLVGNDDCDGN